MKTHELTGTALDWAVQQCEGQTCRWWTEDYTPSTNWAQGGAIIDREGFTLSHSPYDHVLYGRTRPWCAEKRGVVEYGETPLIAAMRCYVASVLGDEVDVPVELRKETP